MNYLPSIVLRHKPVKVIVDRIRQYRTSLNIHVDTVVWPKTERPPVSRIESRQRTRRTVLIPCIVRESTTTDLENPTEPVSSHPYLRNQRGRHGPLYHWGIKPRKLLLNFAIHTSQTSGNFPPMTSLITTKTTRTLSGNTKGHLFNEPHSKECGGWDETSGIEKKKKNLLTDDIMKKRVLNISIYKNHNLKTGERRGSSL